MHWVSCSSFSEGSLLLNATCILLAMVGKAGLGTLTMDGNTRLCTAGAAAAMREVCRKQCKTDNIGAHKLVSCRRSVVMGNLVSLSSICNLQIETNLSLCIQVPTTT
jgi:hypothetical protein